MYKDKERKYKTKRLHNRVVLNTIVNTIEKTSYVKIHNIMDPVLSGILVGSDRMEFSFGKQKLLLSFACRRWL